MLGQLSDSLGRVSGPRKRRVNVAAVSTTSSVSDAKTSPNHEARREELIRAATDVLRRGGVGACSARSIAGASPLTKSALHYYFDDVEQIVDIAFRRLMEEFLSRIEAAAAAEPDPVAALWAAAGTYLRLGSDRPPRVSMLWFEMQVAASRRGDVALMAELTDRALATFGRLVSAVDVAEPEAVASTLFSALVGSVVRNSMIARPTDDVLAELARACGLPAPVPVG